MLNKGVGVKVYMGAVILWVLSFIAYWWYGITHDCSNFYLWYLGGAILDCWLLALAAGYGFVMAASEAEDASRRRKLERGGLIAVLITAMLSMNVMVPHAWARWQLQPIVKLFVEKVSEGPDHQYVVDTSGDHTVVEEDYGGRLDEVLYQRDNWLKANGYTIIGGWHSRDGCTALYVYNWRSK